MPVVELQHRVQLSRLGMFAGRQHGMLAPVTDVSLLSQTVIPMQDIASRLCPWRRRGRPLPDKQ